MGLRPSGALRTRESAGLVRRTLKPPGGDDVYQHPNTNRRVRTRRERSPAWHRAGQADRRQSHRANSLAAVSCVHDRHADDRGYAGSVRVRMQEHAEKRSAPSGRQRKRPASPATWSRSSMSIPIGQSYKPRSRKAAILSSWPRTVATGSPRSSSEARRSRCSRIVRSRYWSIAELGGNSTGYPSRNACHPIAGTHKTASRSGRGWDVPTG